MTGFPTGITSDMSADEALAFTIAFLDTLPDDEMLCRAALTIGEPLVDWHWQVLEEELVDLLAARPGARKLASCCMFDQDVPESLKRRLFSQIRAEEDIGRRSS